MKHIQSKEEFNTASQTGQSIFIFSADWCPDCRIIEPILPETEEKFSTFTFYFVDRDKHIELCQELDIFGIPSFLAFKEGRELDRFVNKERKTKEQIEGFISGLNV